MSVQDVLQLTNLFFIPALIYIVKLEGRLAVLETRLEDLLKHLEDTLKK